MFEELPLKEELVAMEKIIEIITPFPKAQRNRLMQWVLERVNSTKATKR